MKTITLKNPTVKQINDLFEAHKKDGVNIIIDSLLQLPPNMSIVGCGRDKSILTTNPCKTTGT